MTWLPEVIGRWAAMFQTGPGRDSTGLRFGASGDAQANVIGSLRPDAIGNGSSRLPGFYIRTSDADELLGDVPPWGDGGVPLTARGTPLHGSDGKPLV